MAKKEDNVIIIENPVMGWIPETANTIVPLEGSDGQYRYSFGVTTMRPGKKGNIAPAEVFSGATFSDAGPAINSVPRAIAADPGLASPNSAIICGGASGTAPRVVVADNTNTVTSKHDITAPNGNFTTVPSIGYWGEDMCFYPAPNGAITTPGDFGFYTYNTSTHGYLGRYQYGTTTYQDDFVASSSPTLASGSAANLVAAVPHRECVGPDRILYITNGQYLASYDGTSGQAGANGTFNSYALDLGPGWIAVDVQPFTQSYVAIAAVRMGTNYRKNFSYVSEARVILWNGSDLDFTQLYVLNDWYVNSLFVLDNTLFAFTQGISGTTKVKALFPGSAKFMTICEQPTTAIGNAPFPNQVEYFNNLILWNGDTTTNMVFGISEQVTKTGSVWAFHTPYYLSLGSGTVTAAGFLKNVSSNIIFAGANWGTGFKIQGALGDGTSNNSIVTAQAIAKVQFRDRLRTLPYKTTIMKAIARFANFGSDSSAYISIIPGNASYIEDGSGNPTGDILAWTINTSNHPRITTELTASTSELGGKSMIAPDITKFWVNIRLTDTSVSATPPMLNRLEIYFEPVEQP